MLSGIAPFRPSWHYTPSHWQRPRDGVGLIRCERRGGKSVPNVDGLCQSYGRVPKRSKADPIVIFYFFGNGVVLSCRDFVKVRGPCSRGPLVTPIDMPERSCLPVAEGDLGRCSEEGHVCGVVG